MNFNIKTRLVSLMSAAVILFGLTTVTAMAMSFGGGVTGGAMYVDVDGTETMNTSGDTQKASEGMAGALGSIYGQVSVFEERFGKGNGFALGYEQFFGEAALKDTRGNITDKHAVNTSTAGMNNVAEGKVGNMRTIYVETPGFTRLGLYLKAGLSTLDVTTEENMDTGAVYGNGAVDGTTYGFGFKKVAENGLMLKTEYTTTEWDDITLSNSGTDAGAKNVKISPEAQSFKMSLGYNF